MKQFIATTRRPINPGSQILITDYEDGRAFEVAVSDGHHSFDVALNVSVVHS